MATCGSLQHIYDNPIPDDPSSLIESLSSSWKQITSPKPMSPLSSSSSSSSSSSLALSADSVQGGNHSSHQDNLGSYHQRSESFSSMNSESLQLCTEGLGFESLDNIVEDPKIEFDKQNNNNDHDEGGHNNSNSSYTMAEKLLAKAHSSYQYTKGRTDRRAFPPPISCMSRTGKPRVCYQSYREDGRFILKETRIPSQDILLACREDGRLRLNFVQPSEQDDENIIEDDDDDDAEEGEELGAIEGINEDEEGEAQEDGLDKGDLAKGAEIRDGFERGYS